MPLRVGHPAQERVADAVNALREATGQEEQHEQYAETAGEQFDELDFPQARAGAARPTR